MIQKGQVLQVASFNFYKGMHIYIYMKGLNVDTFESLSLRWTCILRQSAAEWITFTNVFSIAALFLICQSKEKTSS